MTNNEAPPVQRALVTATPLKKKIQFFTDGSVSRYRRLCFIKKNLFRPPYLPRFTSTHAEISPSCVFRVSTTKVFRPTVNGRIGNVISFSASRRFYSPSRARNFRENVVSQVAS